MYAITLIASLWTWHGWPALVSIGTLLLAIATGSLAWFASRAVNESKRQIDISAREVEAVERQTGALETQTQAVRDQAEATKRQVEISSAALESSVRPVLVGVAPGADVEREEVIYHGGHSVDVARTSVHYEATDDLVYCSVPLRNVGGGVAFVQTVKLLTRTAYDGRISSPVVPPTEIARVRFAIARRQNDGQATDVNEITGEGGRGFPQFMIYVVYTGASHDLVTASKVSVAGLPDGTFFITGNEILDGDTVQCLLASSANIG